MLNFLEISAAAEANLSAGEKKKYHLEGGDMTETQPAGIDVPVQGLLQLLETRNTVHWVTNNAWSMRELLLALTRTHGALDEVYICTYACSEDSARDIVKLKEQAGCKAIYLLIDNRVETRTAGSLQYLKANATRLVLAPCHAKVTILRFADGRQITVAGSANYTENRRFEAGFVTKSAHVATFHLNWINDALNPPSQRDTGTDKQAG